MPDLSFASFKLFSYVLQHFAEHSWLFGPAGVTHWTPTRGATELLGIFLSVFFVMRYWEAWIVRMRAGAGLPQHPRSLQIFRLRLHGFLVILLIIVGNEVLQQMVREDAVNAVASFLRPFVITYAWILGAQQHPSRAALYGTLAAFILAAGLYWEVMVSVILSWGLLPNDSRLAGRALFRGDNGVYRNLGRTGN